MWLKGSLKWMTYIGRMFDARLVTVLYIISLGVVLMVRILNIYMGIRRKLVKLIDINVVIMSYRLFCYKKKKCSKVVENIFVVTKKKVLTIQNPTCNCPVHFLHKFILNRLLCFYHESFFKKTINLRANEN